MNEYYRYFLLKNRTLNWMNNEMKTFDCDPDSFYMKVRHFLKTNVLTHEIEQTLCPPRNHELVFPLDDVKLVDVLIEIFQILFAQYEVNRALNPMLWRVLLYKPFGIFQNLQIIYGTRACQRCF